MARLWLAGSWLVRCGDHDAHERESRESLAPPPASAPSRVSCAGRGRVGLAWGVVTLVWACREVRLTRPLFHIAHVNP